MEDAREERRRLAAYKVFANIPIAVQAAKPAEPAEPEVVHTHRVVNLEPSAHPAVMRARLPGTARAPVSGGSMRRAHCTVIGLDLAA